MAQSPHHIRQATCADLELMASWTAHEGWNPGPHDIQVAFTLDPKGFWVSEHPEEGTLQGCISGIRYPEAFAFIGYFLVAPHLRGGRIGPDLGARVLQDLDGWHLGMDGVEQKVEQYRHYGFRTAWNNVRHVGQVPCRPPSATTPDSQILHTGHASLLADLDAESFPVRREAFWNLWLGIPGCLALGLTRARKMEGAIVGRPCLEGWKIGPLFAENVDVAEHLLNDLFKQLPTGAPFFLDIPDINPQAAKLVSRYNLRPVFRTARMFKGAIPPPTTRTLFGITSFELG